MLEYLTRLISQWLRGWHLHDGSLYDRRHRNAPINFRWVTEDEGIPVGPPLETAPFPPISTARDQAPHLICCRITDAVLTDQLQANAFRMIGIKWQGNLQVAEFQPVLLD